MSGPRDPALDQTAEQLRYARWLDWGTRIGLVVLVASFVAYVLALSEPRVPVHRLPELWRLPVADFLQASGMPAGWGWLALIAYGDVAGLLGIVVLAGCSLPALLALLPLYLKRGERTFAWLCVAEVAVVALAASGLLTGGH